MSKRCPVCKTKGSGIWPCGCCEEVYYCGEDHQRQHWRHHKHVCIPVGDTHQEELPKPTAVEMYREQVLAEVILNALKSSDTEESVKSLESLHTMILDGFSEDFCIEMRARGAEFVVEALKKLDWLGPMLRVMKHARSHGYVAIVVFRKFSTAMLQDDPSRKKLRNLLLQKKAIRVLVRAMNHKSNIGEPLAMVAFCNGFWCLQDWFLSSPGDPLICDEAIKVGAAVIAVSVLTQVSTMSEDEEAEVALSHWTEFRSMGGGKRIANIERLDVLLAIDAVHVLTHLMSGNFIHKTAVVQAGGLVAVAVVAEKAWNRPSYSKLLEACARFYEVVYCRCKKCMLAKRCANCGEKTTLKCESCSRFRYCSKECLKEHKNVHKKFCRVLPDECELGCARKRDLLPLTDNQGKATNLKKLWTAINEPEASLVNMSKDEVCERLCIIANGEKEAIIMLVPRIAHLLLHIMAKKRAVPDIQAMACSALCSLSSLFFSSHGGIPSPFVSDHVLESVIATLELHQDNPAVVGCVFNYTCIFTALQGTRYKKVDRIVERVMESMHRFPDAYGVQIGGCGTLRHVCTISENRDEFVRRGGIRLLAKTGQRFWDTHQKIDRRIFGALQTTFEDFETGHWLV